MLTPLNVSWAWHLAHFKSNLKLFMKSHLKLGARDMATNMFGITCYDGGIGHPKAILEKGLEGKMKAC